MKNQLLLVSLIIFIAFTGCKKESENIATPATESIKTFKSGVEEPCYEESYTLYGGQTIEVGTLTVSNDEDEIFVTYDLSGTNWYLDATHLYVGAAEDLPLTGSGNPKIGHFTYSENHNSSIDQVYTYTFDREDFEDCFAVAAHAVVVQRNANGGQIDEQTAFADGGTEFPGKRWGWYLEEYCVEDCEPDVVCNGAYIYLSNTDYPNISQCFTDYGFDTFGWTNGPINAADLLANPISSCLHSKLISCPTSCDGANQTVAGVVTIEALGLTEGLDIIFESLEPGFTLESTHLYVGSEPFPVVDGSYLLNPDDFTYSHLNLNGATFDRYKISTSGDVYIILYAVFTED